MQLVVNMHNLQLSKHPYITVYWLIIKQPRLGKDDDICLQKNGAFSTPCLYLFKFPCVATHKQYTGEPETQIFINPDPRGYSFKPGNRPQDGGGVWNHIGNIKTLFIFYQNFLIAIISHPEKKESYMNYVKRKGKYSEVRRHQFDNVFWWQLWKGLFIGIRYSCFCFFKLIICGFSAKVTGRYLYNKTRHSYICSL